MLTGVSRITQLVEEQPGRKLQTLIHLVNETSLKEVHQQQEAGKAKGVDNISKGVYEKDLDKNVKDLVKRMKTFSYHPQPVRRAYIEKEGSDKLRPLGIPAYEDKLVQSVMAEILNEIYEPLFLDCSYGFREGLDCHAAVKQLNKYLMGFATYVVDVDIKGYFNTVNHEWLIKFLEHEIGDKNFMRYIVRFLKSGVMENGVCVRSEEGVVQGGNISPVLANVYLHYVLDLWFERRVKKSCQGRAEMVRYADDVVICFAKEADARWFYTELIERFAKFNLEISEEKSEVIKFGRSIGKDSGKFDFLGFTHYIGKSRKGYSVVKYKTSEKKLKAKRAKIKKFIRLNMHMPVGQLIKKLNVRLQGHYNYYGISHNITKLQGFHEYVKYSLFKALNRRSQRSKMTWERYRRLLEKLPLTNPHLTFLLW